MAYFHFSNNCNHYPNEWGELLDYLKKDLPGRHSIQFQGLEYPIEAKALYVISLSRHLIVSAEKLPYNGNWKPVFIEALILLFPMIELVGQARLGNIIAELRGVPVWDCSSPVWICVSPV